MLRYMCIGLRRPSQGLHPFVHRHIGSTASATRQIHSLGQGKELTEDETRQLDHARRWRSSFHTKVIPRRICKFTFSRSSGPGGQNVNKTNSKASLLVKMSDLAAYLPSMVMQQLRSSRHYSAKSDTLQMQVEETRSQAQNVELGYERLHKAIVEAADVAIPSETSPEQAKRVQQLKRAGNAARLSSKHRHSEKKSARRGKGSSDD